MKQDLSLDDIALFVAVADAGGLAGAAKRTGVSVPTLSRRMVGLERSFRQQLFVRGPRGYVLTSRGRDLLQEAEDLRAVSARLSAFGSEDRQTRVRVTAGPWTSHFLATHIARYWSSDAPWVPEFVTTNATVDISRREADLGVRNRRPEQPWLAGRLTHRVQYAVFATSTADKGYISVSEAATPVPSAIWLRDHHENEVVTTASSSRLALDLALAGVGRIVLPVYAAVAWPALQRVSPLIEELTSEEWLVCHHEGRHDPPVRAALDAISGLLTDRRLRPVMND